MEMAEIKVPIQVNLPDDWIEQIVNRLRNDPDAEWVEIVRCKDCMHYGTYYRGNESEPVITHLCKWCLDRTMEPDDYCSHAERRTDEGGSGWMK